jgi:site-specific recombinase XerD
MQNSLADAVFSQIHDAYSPATMRAYRADWAEFSSYCSECIEQSLPAGSSTVAAFIDRATSIGASSASIRRKLVSIAAVHRWAGHTDATKEPAVKLAVRKMHRKLGRLCKQAEPINQSVYQRMLECTGDDLRGKRDKALLMLAYETMRRRSELTSLLVQDIHVTPNGASILLRKSKTDQERHGSWLHISACALNVVRDWLSCAGIGDGLILRGVMGKEQVTAKLTGGQIGRVFKRLAKSASMSPEAIGHISGHSFRVGAAQDLLTAGASLPQIMAKGGWTNVDTVMRYVEKYKVPTKQATTKEILTSLSIVAPATTHLGK